MTKEIKCKRLTTSRWTEERPDTRIKRQKQTHRRGKQTCGRSTASSHVWITKEIITPPSGGPARGYHCG